MENIQIDTLLQEIRNSPVQSLVPLIKTFKIRNKPLSFDRHYMFTPFFKLNRPKYLTLMCGRQVSKTTSLAELSIILTGMIPGFNTLIVEPSHSQKIKLNAQVIDPLLKGSSIRDKLVNRKEQDSVDIKQFRNGNHLMLAACFKSPDRIRGISGVSLVCLDEGQDLDPSFIPVIESVTDGIDDYGLITTTGSAKRTDDYLAEAFGNSSQAHWGIKCTGCNKYNIASPDQQLIKMIGKYGNVCAFCGKALEPRTGCYVHAYPGRKDFHSGYHIPQTMMPTHFEDPFKWQILLNKKDGNNPALFLNEVLGVASDLSVRLITLQELQEAQNELDNTLHAAVTAGRGYHVRVVGVDWSGGGSGFSRTSIAVMGRHYGQPSTDILYMKTLPHGLTQEAEADEVAAICHMFGAHKLAHDYTGAGFGREVVLLSRHPELSDLVYPISLAHRPTAGLVTYTQSGSRNSYTVDKTRALLLTLLSLRHRSLSVPRFNAAESDCPQKEFLSIVERPQELGKNDTVYVLQRAAGKFDDAAMAAMCAFVCMCDFTKIWPTFPIESRFLLTPEQEALAGVD